MRAPRKKVAKKRTAKRIKKPVPPPPPPEIADVVGSALDEYHGGPMLKAVNETLKMIHAQDVYREKRARWLWEMMQAVGPKIKSLMRVQGAKGNPVAVIQAVARLATVEQELEASRTAYAEKGFSALSNLESIKIQADLIAGRQGESGATPEQFGGLAKELVPAITARVIAAIEKKGGQR